MSLTYGLAILLVADNLYYNTMLLTSAHSTPIQPSPIQLSKQASIGDSRREYRTPDLSCIRLVLEELV